MLATLLATISHVSLSFDISERQLIVKFGRKHDQAADSCKHKAA